VPYQEHLACYVLFSLLGMFRLVVYFFVCLSQSRCQQNQQSLAAGVSYIGCQNGTKFDTLIYRALLYIISKISELWPKGRQNSRLGKKNFLFSYIVCPSAMKFGTIGQ